MSFEMDRFVVIIHILFTLNIRTDMLFAIHPLGRFKTDSKLIKWIFFFSNFMAFWCSGAGFPGMELGGVRFCLLPAEISNRFTPRLPASQSRIKA